MTAAMSAAIARYLNPWKFQREELARRIADLRTRDGDNCARCRRPIRFDLPAGHDQAARIEHCFTGSVDGLAASGSQCLCHGRCTTAGTDHTAEVQERRRRHNEARLLSRSR